MVFNIMVKLVEAVHQENFVFLFLLAVFLLTRQISNSIYLERFMNIIHIIGTFHQQMSFIYDLHKRSRCSGLDDILVTAGIVVQRSVDQALRNRHCGCGVCCIFLWREILIQKCLSQILQYETFRQLYRSLDIVQNAITATQAMLPAANSCLQYDVFMRHLIVFEKP